MLDFEGPQVYSSLSDVGSEFNGFHAKEYHMKNLVLSFGLLALSSAAFADFVTPNSYQCVNKAKKIAIIYNETSYTGIPTLSVKQGDQVSVSTKDLQMDDAAETALGKIVTAFDKNIMDATLNYSLILPNVVLSDTVLKAEFTTQFVTTFGGGMFPPFYVGQTRSNTFTNVKCVATRVVF